VTVRNVGKLGHGRVHIPPLYYALGMRPRVSGSDREHAVLSFNVRP
jgi:hypothetical protein